MVLDLLLASQGGTCKVIATESCLYISTAEVMDMWDLINYMKNMDSSSETSLTGLEVEGLD